MGLVFLHTAGLATELLVAWDGAIARQNLHLTEHGLVPLAASFCKRKGDTSPKNVDGDREGWQLDGDVGKIPKTVLVTSKCTQVVGVTFHRVQAPSLSSVPSSKQMPWVSLSVGDKSRPVGVKSEHPVPSDFRAKLDPTAIYSSNYDTNLEESILKTSIEQAPNPCSPHLGIYAWG